ncbi:multicopper oxidase family protein [Kutzneria buriramensis]|uniref:FtsP/CotA-like multicopper oxidase with cupredoxin domain n=1 Tax=Kutzneria buriramensis TaxID=1045776 RepID=A0A3E0HI33_9PSEU|nr:multicopper oxidase [Kutzneria buriramensis]REH46101.1 FtsP/CotA-like multicopper oxidase with cupredoxin domain [Kutzneria buriramensis]
MDEPDQPLPADDATPNQLGRRSLLRAAKLGSAVAASLSIGATSTSTATPTPLLAGDDNSGLLDPTRIPKYAAPLPVLPTMPRSWATRDVDGYAISVWQFRQQVLPQGFPSTTVWGYGSANRPKTAHSPGFTIEAHNGRPVQVNWVNQLVDRHGHYLPHLLPVDPTLHWANPPGGRSDRDTHPMFATTPPDYRGPVPIVTHLHGGHSTQESDGYPSAWYLPRASDIPTGYARVGSYYDPHRDEAVERLRVRWRPGTAVFQYANDQPATMLWYHDHTLGMTRLNQYAGLSGCYVVRGGRHDLPAGVLPTGRHEIVLVIQDRSFTPDGSLFFPPTRGFAADIPPDARFVPFSDVPPLWTPQSFGSTMVVNGCSWPVLTVEARRYRFRVLNACNARTLVLKIAANPLAARPAPSALSCWQIGADGGFLPTAVRLGQVLCAPAERADLIVDFTGVRPGSELYLINEGPAGPFSGAPGTAPADPTTTGQVMKFVVAPPRSSDTSVPPAQLRLPAAQPLDAAGRTWRISLNDMTSRYYQRALISMMLGTVRPDGSPEPLAWGAAVTESPAVNATEVWELTNFTPDAHPIHIHQVQFQVLDRRRGNGPARPPEPWETGRKDTVIVYPGETTRVAARFDLPGRYVMHCHILDHEDNEMMRPIQVLRSQSVRHDS